MGDFKDFFKQIFAFCSTRILLSQYDPKILKAVHFFPMIFTLGCVSIPFWFLVSKPIFTLSITLILIYILLNFTDICVFSITKLLDMKFPFFKIIFIGVFGSIILFDGCKSSVVSPDACVKVAEPLSAATKTYDTTSTLALDTLRKRASCMASGLALRIFIK